MESHLPHSRRTVRTDSYVLRLNKLPGHLPDDDEHHLPNRSSTRLVIHLYGQYRRSYEKRRTRNGTTTCLSSPAICPSHVKQIGTKRPIPQTRKMQLRAKRDRLPRC